MSRHFRLAALTAAALTAAAINAGASPIVHLAGTTDGCFDLGCSSFAGTASSGSAYGLTFTGGSFDVTTDATGSANGMLLGTLHRGNVNTPSSTPALDFMLRLLFSTPAGETLKVPVHITGANPGGGGPLALDLPSSKLVSFAGPGGSGSFELFFADMELTKNGSTSIYAWVRGASFTAANPPVDEPDPQTVPEPATILLAGLGTAAVLRRRARKP